MKNKKEILKWAKEVQIDKDLKILSDMKVAIDNVWDRGYSNSWELKKLLDRIDDLILKKRSDNEVVNLINVKLKSFYEEIGRYGAEQPNNTAEILIKNIKEILDKTSIPENYLVISKLKLDMEDEND